MSSPSVQASAQTSAQDYTPTPQAKRAAVSAFMGGMLEYYDFFIYASASALVFRHIFFPANLDPAVSALATFSIFGSTYLARPLGALILGNLGDRIGRKNVLVICLLLMGGATFAMGFIPRYDSIGLWAPAILTLLRLCQGFSAGGETAGGASLLVEHAPARRRGFFGSWTVNGIAAGIILANLVFLPVAALPDEQLFSWGWRIPFWASLVVIIVALIIRAKLEEPERFEAVKEELEQEVIRKEVPVLVMFRDHWRELLRVVMATVFTATNIIISVWVLAYATGVIGIPRTTMLWVTIVANVFVIIFQTVAGSVSDRVGRRPVFIIGCVGLMVMIWPYFKALESGSVPLIFLAAIALTGVFYSLPNGIYPAFFAEMFPTAIRYTGVAIGLQIGSLVAGFAPTISAWLVGSGGTTHNWGPVAWLVTGLAGVSALGAFLSRETHLESLDDLDTQSLRQLKIDRTTVASQPNTRS